MMHTTGRSIAEHNLETTFSVVSNSLPFLPLPLLPDLPEIATDRSNSDISFLADITEHEKVVPISNSCLSPSRPLLPVLPLLPRIASTHFDSDMCFLSGNNEYEKLAPTSNPSLSTSKLKHTRKINKKFRRAGPISITLSSSNSRLQNKTSTIPPPISPYSPTSTIEEEEMNNSKSNEPCKFFLRNSCKKGSTCPYSHNIPCKFFHLQQRCQYGRFCRFSHDSISHKVRTEIEDKEEEKKQKLVVNLPDFGSIFD